MKTMNNLLGKTLEEAKTYLEESGFTWRIVSTDGSLQLLTCDFKYNRVNLTIENGYITGAKIG
jgi:hypothetical protein